MHCPARHPHITQTLLLLSVSSSHSLSSGKSLSNHAWVDTLMLFPQVVRSHLQVSAEKYSPVRCLCCSFSFDIWYAVKGKLTCSHFPPDCLYLGNHDDLFSIFSYESDFLGLMEEDDIPIRSVGSYAVEMDPGHLKPLPSLHFLLTVLTKFLRLFACFRGNHHIAESFGLAKMSE